MRIQSGQTNRYIFFVAVDATDFKTRETGLSSFTVYRVRDDGSATAYTSPTVTEVDSTNMPGVYKLLVDEDTTMDGTNDTEEYVLHITHAGMAPVTRSIELYRINSTAVDMTGLLATVVESQGSITIQQALQILVAVLAGVTTTNGKVFKTPNGSATRLTFTIDTSNTERDAVSLEFA